MLRLGFAIQFQGRAEAEPPWRRERFDAIHTGRGFHITARADHQRGSRVFGSYLRGITSQLPGLTLTITFPFASCSYTQSYLGSIDLLLFPWPPV